MKFVEKAFGKRTEAPKTVEEKLEERFAQAVKDFNANATFLDSTLQEMVSDYVGLVTFNEAAGVFADTVEIEKQKKLILEYLKKTQR